MAHALEFSVVPTRNTWTIEQILRRLPENDRLRFPADLPALKAKITERMEALS